MKYNNNGEWKDIIVKATDTLPIGTEVDYNGTDVPDGWEEVEDTVTKTLKAVYPIGSIYINTTSVNPKDIFGFGTWEKIDDVFLFGTSDAAQLGNTGGSVTHTHTTGNHTLTVNEMPNHTHTVATVYPFEFGGARTAVANSNSNNRSGTATDVVDSTGGSQPHNHGDTGSSSNMPPYLIVFMWKRTA